MPSPKSDDLIAELHSACVSCAGTRVFCGTSCSSRFHPAADRVAEAMKRLQEGVDGYREQWEMAEETNDELRKAYEQRIEAMRKKERERLLKIIRSEPEPEGSEWSAAQARRILADLEDK